MLGEWSDTLSAFWMGANNCEFVAFKGSHQVFVFDCDEYPQPPTEIIQHDTRINTLEEFDRALRNGKWFTAKYDEKPEEKPSGVVVKQKPTDTGWI